MKVKSIRTLEAKSRFSELLRQVQKGVRYRITRHGKPVAELRPIPSSKKHPKAGFAKGTFTFVVADFEAPLRDFKEYSR